MMKIFTFIIISNPSAIASYYYSAVRKIHGVLTRIWLDDGTENSIIDPIKICLSSAHDEEFGGIESFLKGKSPANQKIESLRSQLAIDRPIPWGQHFTELFSLGFIDSSSLIVVIWLQEVAPIFQEVDLIVSRNFTRLSLFVKMSI